MELHWIVVASWFVRAYVRSLPDDRRKSSGSTKAARARHGCMVEIKPIEYTSFVEENGKVKVTTRSRAARTNDNVIATVRAVYERKRVEKTRKEAAVAEKEQRSSEKKEEKAAKKRQRDCTSPVACAMHIWKVTNQFGIRSASQPAKAHVIRE
eukprot:IDg10044t1